jgi:hypothetical protein
MLKNLLVGIVAIVLLVIAITLIPILAVMAHLAWWIICFVGVIAMFIAGFVMLGWIISNLIKMAKGPSAKQ